MLSDLENAAAMLDSIVVFRGVRNGSVLCALKDFFEEDGDLSRRVSKYTAFVSALFEHGYNFSRYLLDAAAEDGNAYVMLRSKGEEIPQVLEECVRGELSVFQKLSDISPSELAAFTGYKGYLPTFETSKLDFAAEYEKRISEIRTTGYGIYAKNVMFRVKDGEIVPVRSPDKTDVKNLIGYERERGLLIDNTAALIAGRPAANTLLCGDAGTGKSSSVKAVVNMFAPQGVRLIEVSKEQLREIPSIMEHLRDNPLKFIIFIDDLSFNKNDDNFSALKAILEGSASVKAANTVIYATSNRRHLVKETFGDRDGDDVHRNDTMQELLSLSERFGLTILFTRPSKTLYLEIVHELCKAKGIKMDEGELDIKAAAFALRRGGASPRAAEQFTDSLLTGKYLEEQN
ncbi:MAG: ATP-binding protein [Oscillospiraceae bacterium]